MPSPEAVFKIREPLSSGQRLQLWAASIGMMLLLWFIVTWGEPAHRIYSPLIVPAPMEVLRAFGPLHFEQGLVRAMLSSLTRVTVGFLIAMSLAIPLGIAMGSFSKLGAFGEPLALFLGYVPVVTIIPLTIAWFGLTEAQIVGFLVIGIFAFLLPLVVKSINSVDDIYVQTGYTLGADRWQTVRFVLVPVAMSKIFGHLRMLYGVGWGYIMLAEYTAMERSGLGSLMAIVQRRSLTDRVFAILLVIVLIAVIVDKLLKTLGESMFPYEVEA